MNGPRTNRLSAALMVAGSVCALLAAYAAGYVYFSQRFDDPFSPTIDRVFNAEWQTSAFIPAAFVEAKIRRESIALCTGHYDWEGYDSYTVTWKIDP